MENKPLGISLGSSNDFSRSAHKPETEERSVIGKVKDFFERQIIEKDGDSGDYKVNRKMYGVAAAETLAVGALGYKVGAENQAQDVVTHETVMRDVMETVPDGMKTVTGGHHYHYGYHYDISEGKSKFGYHYGYDGSWVHDEMSYKQVPTGEKVPEVLTHHTVPRPYTALAGVLTGTAIGAVLGVLTILISKIIAEGKN